MFDITLAEDGVIALSGRLDASQSETAQSFLDGVADPTVLDLAQLEYISSAGLGVLLRTQKRLAGSGRALKLINVNNHINDVFRYSGFNRLFEIAPAGQKQPD